MSSGSSPILEGDTDTADVGVVTVSANGVYHFDTPSGFVPYATFGLGFGHVSLDLPISPTIRTPSSQSTSAVA